jgi:hypothetical protein
MGLGGWIRAVPGLEPFDDWVIMRMEMAALALPDVTMCRGTYPVPVGRPYVSGQEGVGMIEDVAPSQAAGFLIASHTAYHVAIRRGSRLLLPLPPGPPRPARAGPRTGATFIDGKLQERSDESHRNPGEQRVRRRLIDKSHPQLLTMTLAAAGSRDCV